MPVWRLGRFGWLLVSLVALLVLTPFLDLLTLDLPRSRLLSSVVLLAGVYSLRRHPWMFRFGFALAGSALVAAWLSQQFSAPALVIADFLLTGSFLALITGLIFDAVLATNRVTLDTLLGGVSMYLLLGVLWVSLYSALEYAVPGSFVLDGTPLSALPDAASEVHRYPELLYFSFVTLTTLGYGDVVPTNGFARALAAGEAILGQVYLAVFVASLVGLHLVQRRTE